MKKIIGCLFVCLLWAFNLKAQQPDTVTVYFPFDQAALTSDAEATIDQFVQAYKNGNGYTQLEVRGHCDAIGSNSYNEQLSERRVEAVLQYLKQQGISDTAIRFSKGYGEQVPRQDNSTAAGRQQNRRVEIIWQESTARVLPPPQHVKPKDTIPELTQETINTVQEGQTLRLRNINFYGGSHRFLPESEPALQQLLAVMKNNPSLVIEIQGHICCLPGERDGFDYDANDWNLSLNRAHAVYNFLYKNGIDAKRMSYKGFAGRVPLVYPEQTEADRTTNRRVEIKIIKR